MTPTREPKPIAPAIAPADDDLDELPPMDGDDGDGDAEETDAIDELEDGGDPLDDSTGEGDPIDTSEIEAGRESGYLDDADDAEGLDVGAELASFEDAGAHDPRLDFEEPGVGDEDFGLGGDESRAELDAGEEGPSAADEEMREQDLPPLDADEEGELDDVELIDAGFAPAAETLPRAALPWAEAGAPVDVGPVRAIACAGRDVVVATALGLARVDLEGAVTALAADGLASPVARLAVDGDALAAVTTTGEIAVSRDGGATFQSAWRDRASLSTGGAADVAFAGGALWARTRGGALLRSGDLGVTWEAVVVGGAVAAIAAERELAVLLVADSDRVRLVHRPGPSSLTVEVPGVEGVGGALAIRGAHAAFVAEGGLVVDGAPVPRVAGVDALAFLDDAGAVVVAVYRDVEDATSLVSVARGTAEIVAEVGSRAGVAGVDAGGDGARVCALVCDDAHGVVWVGGAFGLLAFEPRGPLSSAV